MTLIFVAFSFSWCGYANGLSFKEIGEADIQYIENFVRNELQNRLLEICERNDNSFGECEKQFFFGIYASSVSEFKFLRGERIQILAIADILRKLIENNGAEAFKKDFEPPKTFKICKGGVIQSSVGLVYAEKKHQTTTNKHVDSNQLRADLLPKLQRMFEIHSQNSLQPIDEKIITIVALENGFRADVLCVLCPVNDFEIETKKHAIQYDKKGSWNLSNLKKHLKRHNASKKVDLGRSHDINGLVRQPNTPQTAKDSPQINSTFQLNESHIMSMPIYCEGDDQTKRDSSPINQNSSIQTLYQQFTTQNLQMVKATMTNNESKKFVAVSIDGRTVNLSTLEIKKNGNCMFSSLAHQLYSVKTNSKEHDDLTAKLRNDVVHHILNNFDEYKQAIEIDFGDLDEDVAGKEYISTDLSKNGV